MANSWDYFYYLPPIGSTLLRWFAPLFLHCSLVARNIDDIDRLRVFYRRYCSIVRVLRLPAVIADRLVSSSISLVERPLLTMRKHFPARKKFRGMYSVIRNLHRHVRLRLDNDFPDWFAIDDWYPVGIDRFLARLDGQFGYDAVLVEYVFMSAALHNFSDSVLKINDTHDVFTERSAGYAKSGVKERFFTTSRGEEYKGLVRADVIIAIQHQEAVQLNQIADRVPIATVGHIVEQVKPQQRMAGRMNIMYIGSPNPSNIHGINWFLSEVFPAVRARIPSAKLILGGLIGEYVTETENCLKLGDIEKVGLKNYMPGAMLPLIRVMSARDSRLKMSRLSVIRNLW